MSVLFKVEECVRWTDGVLARGTRGAVLSGVTIDSRAASAGDLFVAIVGPNHDAHDFVGQAALAGAAGLLVARDYARDHALDLPADADVAVVAVDDTTRALGALAAGHREGFEGPVVAITGSSGKTTTKEMCAAVLAAAGPCLKTEGNLNNEYGLPLTLLRREPRHERAVVELGMSHRGEIAGLAAIARPDVAIVTNVGVAHIEFLGSREEIAREKGDLYASLGSEGVAVANRDDALAFAQAARAPGRVIGFGTHADADVRAEGARFVDCEAWAFELCAPEGRVSVRVTGLAATTVPNALAAAAAGLAAGVPLAGVASGLAVYRPPAGRMAPFRTRAGAMGIDDSYNANPQSLRTSLEALARLKGEGRGVAVLGDMGELGEAGDEAHRDAGRWVAELGLDTLLALGERAPDVVLAAREAGMDADRARAVEAPEDVAHELADLDARDWVLVKGSRAMKLERVVEALREAPGSEETR